MNVESGAEAALFPEKEYICGIFIAVYSICKQGYIFNIFWLLYSLYTNKLKKQWLLYR